MRVRDLADLTDIGVMGGVGPLLFWLSVRSESVLVTPPESVLVLGGGGLPFLPFVGHII